MGRPLGALCRHDFYPRPPRGGRHRYGMAADWRMVFLSTPSARRATASAAARASAGRISIHALREEGDDFLCPEVTDAGPISIHALREEGDTADLKRRQTVRISIHALREEGDRGSGSTRAAREHFYPRPPRGGRRAVMIIQRQSAKISINALREEGDILLAGRPS